MRVISAAEIAAAKLDLRTVYDLVLEGFNIIGRGEVECPPKIGIHPRPFAFTHVMSAYVPNKDIAGSKLISVYPSNTARGLPTTCGLIILQDPETGIATDLMDASWVTSIRTAMVSMVDVMFLAKPKPTFGIVGATGATGRAHIESIAAIFPGSRVNVGSRSQERLQSLLSDFKSAACELIPADNNETIVRESDVVIACSLRQAEPVLKSSWVQQGQNLLCVNSRSWPRDILASIDRVSCDDRRPITHPETGLLDVYPGLDPDIELGQVVIGNSAGRIRKDEIILSINYGLAIFDVLVADFIGRAI